MSGDNNMHQSLEANPSISISKESEDRLVFWAAPDDAVFLPAVVSSILGLNVSTLAKMRSEGTGPAYCRRGHARYYRKRDVVEWMTAEREAA